MKLFGLGYLQFNIKAGDIVANLATVKDRLATLAPSGPGLLVLPELWAGGFIYDKMAGQAARTNDLLAEVTELAGHYNIYLAGSLPERNIVDGKEKFFNTLYFVGPDGVAGQYRKQQLFAPFKEDQYFVAGNRPRPVKTTLGLVGGLVCYDLRFPELARLHTVQGARLLAVSAQWPLERLAHWRTLLKARAVENQIFIAATNGSGEAGSGNTLAGHSLLIGPDGAVLSEAGTEAAAVYQEVEPALVDRVRARFNTAGTTPWRSADSDKIVSLAKLTKIVEQYKKTGRKLVFTNGCFDILHEGHVSYLEAARQQGDCLLVGLNNDASIRSIKGPERPVNNENSRARVLAALGCVDHVVLFGDDTPLELIAGLLPDVLVKGADWAPGEIVGAAEVMANGGQVVTVDLVEKISTTILIKKIKNQPA